MSYRIYKTEAFVFASRDVGEADRSFELYTREFGFIRATALGIRELRSKLRYGLQRYAKVSLCLVKGKHGWRITNVVESENFFMTFRGQQKKFLMTVRVFSLLRRLLQGEEQNESLFTVLEKGFMFLTVSDESAVPQIEPVFVLRILDRLGYVGKDPETSTFLGTAEWQDDLLSSAALKLRKLIGSINDSLRESQL